VAPSTATVRFCPFCGTPLGSFFGTRAVDGTCWCERCGEFFRVRNVDMDEEEFPSPAPGRPPVQSGDQSCEERASMSDTTTREVIIIGGGPAGYTAALYAARANLRPLVIEGFAFGGQLMITSDVENYPGFEDGIVGPELMTKMRQQAERFGAELVTDDVTRVDFSERPFRVWVGDDEHRANAVIVATGATARQLGLESEVALQGRGVSYCAVCDAAFFRDQQVVVVGGGDSAMEEASFLAKFAKKVTVVHRRDEFRASRIMLDYARSKDNVEFVTNAVVDDVLGTGTGKVTGVRVRNAVTGDTRELPADGFFVAIGHDPTTNVEGVFAAGDVVDHVYRQAVTAAGMGCMAALDAERWLTARAAKREHESSTAAA
jgi:thioredoxin reductase (NADPH)